MKIATVSLNQIWENKKDNLILCEEYIKMASNKKVDLIVFPEMTLTGFSINISLISEDKQGSETISKFCRLAEKYSIAILFGLVIQDENKALNKAIFVDKNGNILGKYTKIHPFSFSREDKYFNAGRKIEIVKFNSFNIGLTICYDLRFPELYSALAKDSDMILNIANWPKKRVEHWRTLLKARAIENQLFIVGVNRAGEDGNKHKYEESSNIYDANGEVVKFNSFDDMKIYTITKEKTAKIRKKFNTVNDRKIDLYKRII